MIFILSKIVGFFAMPSNLLISAALLGLLLTYTRFVRLGHRLAACCIVLLAIIGFSPLGNALMLSLEQRFPPWSAAQRAPDGIIMLGGGIEPAKLDGSAEPALNEAAERVTAVAALARQFPHARIVLAGGNSSLTGGGPSEASLAVPLLESSGIAASRLELEVTSRNTYENAVFTTGMIKPKPGERWLLVTSAYHMPRAVGCFRRAGLPVEAYPVDWRAGGRRSLTSPFGSVAAGLDRTDIAVREWLGVAAYWVTGRTSELFPGPR